MVGRIKRLTSLQEGILVVTIGLGLFIFSSIRSLIIISTEPAKAWNYFFDKNALNQIFTIEVLALFLIAFILIKRDWKLQDFNFNFSFRVFIDAIIILLVTGFITGLAFRLVTSGRTEEIQNVSVTYAIDGNYLFCTVVLIINSFFEEGLYVGYLSKRLEKFHPGLFIFFSSVLRTIVHLYQGFSMAIVHFTTGLIFSTYYSKYKNLMALIIAHTLWNLLLLWRQS